MSAGPGVTSLLPPNNECEGCQQNCATCKASSNFYELYPLDIDRSDRILPNTIYRWRDHNQIAIDCWTRGHCDPRDWRAQIDWMNENPHVAYHLVNFSDMPNPNKIAKIVNTLREMSFGVIVIMGYQRGGKTMTFAWICWIVHSLKPNKRIYYVGDKSKFPNIPPWFEIVDDINKVPMGSILGIDEAAIRFPARGYHRKPHEYVTDLCVLAGQKKLTILFLTQNPDIIEINVLRLCTAVIFKPISRLIPSSKIEGFIKKISSFLPRDRKQTLWIDMRTDEKTLYYQPLPYNELCSIGDAFADYDVTKKETLFPVSPTNIPKRREERELHCNRCGNDWITFRSILPRRCANPDCRSERWNMPGPYSGGVHPSTQDISTNRGSTNG